MTAQRGLYHTPDARNAAANGLDGSAAAEYVCTCRRNNSLSAQGRLLAFGLILILSIGIAAGFAVVLGAWPILPFAGIEMVVLYLAFRYLDRHAADYERVMIRGDVVVVEIGDAGVITRFELNRCWAQVVCEGKGARIALRSHGREIALGRHLADEQRKEMARDLARELRRW